MATSFQELHAQAVAEVEDYETHARASLHAREQRDVQLLTKKHIEADFAQKEYTGTNQKVRDAQQQVDLDASDSYQDVLADVRRFEHDLAEADINMEVSRLSIRLMMVALEHENAIASDVRIFDERFRDSQPPERGNAGALLPGFSE